MNNRCRYYKMVSRPVRKSYEGRVQTQQYGGHVPCCTAPDSPMPCDAAPKIILSGRKLECEGDLQKCPINISENYI